MWVPQPASHLQPGDLLLGDLDQLPGVRLEGSRGRTVATRMVSRGLGTASYGGLMYQWSDEHQMIRTAMKDFIAKEIIPIRDDLEHGDLPPYDVLRKLYAQFGIAEQAEASFWKRLEFRGQYAVRREDCVLLRVEASEHRHVGGQGARVLGDGVLEQDPFLR